jgi:glycosyltransferase involved in cell wall biosynthesis
VLTPLLRKVADNLSLVYYFSSVQKEDYEKYLPNMLNKIKFLRWGVDFTKYIPANCVLEDTILMIGYQGSGFRDWKTLIEAWRKVSTKKDTVLVIVGKHSLTPQEAGTNDLPKNIRFAGVVDLAGLNSLTQRSRFIVLPLPERRHAYAQMTLLGCMAIGKAVIVSKVSGVIDCVEDMATAVLHELANPEDLAEKMLMLLSDPALADSIGKKAMDCVRKNYTEEIMAKDIYESVTDLFGAGIRF